MPKDPNVRPTRDSAPDGQIPTPADEADQIGGDVNPYPVGDVRHALEEAGLRPDEVGSPLQQPLDIDPSETPKR